MAVWDTFHTSRKLRRCATDRSWDDCTQQIKPGERYCRSVMSPYHDDHGNEGWWRMDMCLRCAKFYRITDPEMVGAS